VLATLLLGWSYLSYYSYSCRSLGRDRGCAERVATAAAAAATATVAQQMTRVPGTGWVSGYPACELGAEARNLWARCNLLCHTHTHTHTHTHHPRASCRPRYHTHTLLFLQCYCLATNHIPQHDSRPCGLHGTQIRDVRMQDQSCLWNVVWRVDDVEGPPIRSAPLGVWRRLQDQYIYAHHGATRLCKRPELPCTSNPGCPAISCL
jgi:hypothetical protein